MVAKTFPEEKVWRNNKARLEKEVSNTIIS